MSVPARSHSECHLRKGLRVCLVLLLDDVAYDVEGKPTTDPAEALKGALRVFDR